MRIERTKNAKRNIVFGVALRLYQIIIPFAMRTIMVYTLGVQFLGLNSLFTSILLVLNLAELGVGSAMVYSMYKPISEDDHTTICALINLYKVYYRIIGAVVLIGGLVVTPFVPKLISGDVPESINIYVLYLLNLLVTVMTYWVLAYRNSILQAHQRTDVVSKVTILTDTIKYILQIAALLIFKNYYYYVIAILATQLLTNIITAAESKRLYPQFTPCGKLGKKEVQSINSRIKDLFTTRLGTTFVFTADTLVISAFLGLNSLAIYQNYYFIMTAVISFIGVFLTACTAGIGNSFIVDTIEKNYADFKKFSLMIIWIAGICVCCFLNVYQPFMKIWMGEANLLSFGCVVLMSIYFYLYVTNNFMCTYKDAAGIWHEDRFRPLVASLTNLCLNLVLVKFLGVFAIILSTVLSYILVTMPWLIHNLFCVLFKRTKKDFLLLFFGGTISVVIASVMSFFLCYFLPEGLLGIVSRVVVSVIVSNCVFIILLGHGKVFEDALEMIDRITKNKMKRITDMLRRGEEKCTVI